MGRDGSRTLEKKKSEKSNAQWGSFTKGADGLLVEQIDNPSNKNDNEVKVHSIIEVKSMICSKKRIINQINNHISRLEGDVRLNKKEYSAKFISINPNSIRIMVKPSSWKLNREWHRTSKDNRRTMIVSEFYEPTTKTKVEELESNLWQITLGWSQEALNQAAYEMTFWYMSQVGKQVYLNKKKQKNWEYMTSEGAGYNSIKMMLYYILLRYISERQLRIATRLYNVYCFGYPLGADSKEMLWPEDFPDK